MNGAICQRRFVGDDGIPGQPEDEAGYARADERHPEDAERFAGASKSFGLCVFFVISRSFDIFAFAVARWAHRPSRDHQ